MNELTVVDLGASSVVLRRARADDIAAIRRGAAAAPWSS
jgi:hypothetical protein